MKKYANGQYVELTEEEIAEFQKQSAINQKQERSRPLTADEVYRILISNQINTLTVDDNTAIRMREFYPDWAPDTEYTAKAGRTVGYKVQHGGKLWKLKTEHTSFSNWAPGATGMESLWDEVCETHAGTEDDPIPYSGNMVLENGKYYHQDYVIYLCTRDTVNPVYNAMSELIGIYVEVV